VKAALAGESNFYEDLPLVMNRTGSDELTYFTFSYSPVRDEKGDIAGIFCTCTETTRQVLGHKALRESQARLELATKAAALGIWDWEIATGRMTYSPLAKAICGFAPDLEVTYEDAKHVTHPDDYPRTSAMAQRALDPAIREVQSYEYRILRPDGSVRWVMANGEAVFAEIDGVVQATRYVGTIRDVTERKQAEQALHEQAAVSSQLAEGVIVANSEGKLTFVNDAAARLHGVAELGVEPEHYSETYHLFTEDNRPYPPMDLPLSRALQGEIVEDARWRIERLDGTSVLAIGSARPLRDESGAQVGAVLTVRDDTARDAAERELRENEARLRALTDNLPGGMVYQISTGKDGSARKFLFVSASHERLTGVPAEAVLKDPTIPYQLIHPEDRPRLVQAEMEAIRDRKPFDVQVRFHRADGSERWCRILSACREQPDGSLLWEGLQIDVTEQVEAEKAIHDLNATLEERVAQRTSERNLLATLVEATDVMVMACDLQYNILAVNRANADEFERVYGIRPKAGDNLLDLLADQPTIRRRSAPVGLDPCRDKRSRWWKSLATRAEIDHATRSVSATS
jgi:PAS domain S-box-containing protein